VRERHDSEAEANVLSDLVEALAKDLPPDQPAASASTELPPANNKARRSKKNVRRLPMAPVSRTTRVLAILVRIVFALLLLGAAGAGLAYYLAHHGH
jgi:hypothetical protein